MIPNFLMSYYLKKFIKKHASSKVLRIAFVRNRGLGDSLLLLSNAYYFKKSLEQSLNKSVHLTLYTPAWTVPLLKSLTTKKGDVFDDIQPLSLRGWKNKWSFYKGLKQKKLDLILELNLRYHSYKFFSFLSFTHNLLYFYHDHALLKNPLFQQSSSKKKFSKNRSLRFEKLGWTIPFLGHLMPYTYRDFCFLQSLSDFLQSRFHHLSENNCHISIPPLEHFMIQLKMKSKEFKELISVSQSNQSDLKETIYVIFCMVASSKIKKWPWQKFKELAESLQSYDFYHIEISCPLSKEVGDLEFYEDIDSKLKQDWHFDFSSLSECALKWQTLLEKKQKMILIGNDTGLRHLACLMGIPTITLFGPESPLEWHPYPKEQHPYFFIEDLSCRTEDGNHWCSLKSCQHHTCMRDLSVDAIARCAIDLIQKI